MNDQREQYRSYLTEGTRDAIAGGMFGCLAGMVAALALFSAFYVAASLLRWVL